MKATFVVSLCLLLLLNKDSLATEDAESLLTVTTTQGAVKGIKSTTQQGKTFYSFHGIPFAEPPVGDLRFKKPVPGKDWKGVLDGTEVPEPCVQFLPPMLLQQEKATTFGNEDCLYLSVHTPKPNSKYAYLPVMVYIHGGGFFFGSIKDYPPHPMLENDVVIVQMQYRLGTLGFLSTEDDVLPGNLGLRDQTLALQWVQKNIGFFGGDSLRVTIFGESAGGASVHYQILSHHSVGLFHRAILQSGTAVCPWSLGGAFKRVAHKVGSMMNCTTEEGSQALVDCLRTKDAGALTQAVDDLQIWNMFPILLGPRVDGDYIMKDPNELLKEGRHKKLSIIIGTTRDEGAFVSLPIYANEFLRQEMVRDFNFYGPLIMEFSEGDLSPLNQTIQIFDKYMKEFKIDEQSAEAFNKLLTHRHMSICHDITAMLHADNVGPNKQVYKYELHKRPLVTMANSFQLSIGNDWVSHADDLIYMFEGSWMFPKIEDEDNLKFRKIINTLWYNFANTGNPTPDNSLGFTWKAMTSSDQSLLILDSEPNMIKDRRKEIRKFWFSLPTKQNMILHPENIKNLEIISKIEKEESENKVNNDSEEEITKVGNLRRNTVKQQQQKDEL